MTALLYYKLKLQQLFYVDYNQKYGKFFTYLLFSNVSKIRKCNRKRRVCGKSIHCPPQIVTLRYNEEGAGQGPPCRQNSSI